MDDESSGLETLYDAIINEKSLDGIHFWRSEVHYARAAIEYNVGVRLTLEETHRYLVEEGLLKEHQK